MFIPSSEKPRRRRTVPYSRDSLHDQADLRAQIRAGLHGRVDVRLRRVRRVLDLSAARTRGGTSLRAVRMHHCPQPDGLRFVTEDPKLILGDRCSVPPTPDSSMRIF